MRIAFGCIGHETNTFSSVPTSINSFKKGSYYVGEEIISAFSHTSTITGGFIENAKKLGMELVPLLWTFATPSGMVDQNAYQILKNEFLNLLRDAREIDGVLLDLHGAMVTEQIEDAEGDLIQAVREVVGALPIVTTLDLHANITPEMAEYAEVIIGFDTYPHVDCYDRGLEAAEVMSAIVQGQIHPRMAYRQLPFLTSPPAQCTMKPLMSEVLERLYALEAQSEVVTATLSMGFPFADIRHAGVSVLVTTDGDQQLAEQHVDEFASYIWEIRQAFNLNLVSVEQAIEQANNTKEKPIILAEGSDNPGGGGPCDGTIILNTLIKNQVEGAVIAVIADPESVDLAIQAGVGNSVDLNVGGKTDPLHGNPVSLTGYVKTISDGNFVHKGPMGQGRPGRMGKTVVIEANGIEIILTEKRIQPYDAEVLRSVGIEPTDRRLIVLKSAVHFRADYTPIAHQILEVDTPGVHSPDLFSYDYHRLRRPIYPLDLDTDWST
jgi:microcystin degradation protein MlrC